MQYCVVAVRVLASTSRLARRILHIVDPRSQVCVSPVHSFSGNTSLFFQLSLPVPEKHFFSTNQTKRNIFLNIPSKTATHCKPFRWLWLKWPWSFFKFNYKSNLRQKEKLFMQFIELKRIEIKQVRQLNFLVTRYISMTPRIAQKQSSEIKNCQLKHLNFQIHANLFTLTWGSFFFHFLCTSHSWIGIRAFHNCTLSKFYKYLFYVARKKTVMET